KGPNWLFDLDYLTDSMNYQPVRSENQAYKNVGPKEANHSASTKDNIDAENSEMEAKSAQDYFVLRIWSFYTSTMKSLEAKNEGDKPTKSNEKPVDQEDQAFLEELERLKTARASSTNTVNTASTPVSTDSYDNPNDGIFTNASYDDEGAVDDFTNLETIVNGHRQEEGINYDEVFAPVARIEAIRIFLAFTSYMGFIVYQMDVKSVFLYGTIDEELLEPEILKKFDFASVKTASTPIETQKPLVKDEETTDVDVHLYRSMIGSLMYLTASRPDIMFAVCACSSFSDSDYAGVNLDRKSTTGGCQFLGRRLISWQCKKQTIVATSTIKAEYVATDNCRGQVLWIQNQMLDYGFNFMNTKFYIDNESIICIVKNPVFHSITKHIEIWYHFIMDAYEKKLIQDALVKGRQDDLLYSLYEVFCEQKNLDNGDVFQRVIWVLESN
ncbi:putative ribonuclease H-like domain-containing protein, partial [Tanacetum coccineum]